MGRTVHGHYGARLEQEAARIQKEYQDRLGISISWREATDIAAMRSLDTIWPEKKLKEVLARLRGL